MNASPIAAPRALMPIFRNWAAVLPGRSYCAVAGLARATLATTTRSPIVLLITSTMRSISTLRSAGYEDRCPRAMRRLVATSSTPCSFDDYEASHLNLSSLQILDSEHVDAARHGLAHGGSQIPVFVPSRRALVVERLHGITGHRVDLNPAAAGQIDELNPPVLLHPPRPGLRRPLPGRIEGLVAGIAAIRIRHDGHLPHCLRWLGTGHDTLRRCAQAGLLTGEVGD